MNSSNEYCEKHKGSGGIGSDPKDWMYVNEVALGAIDIMYTAKAVFPPKEKFQNLYKETSKKCFIGNACEPANLKKIGECMKGTTTEGFLTIIGDDYIEKNMNDANCKELRMFFDGEGGKKINEHIKKKLDAFDPAVVRKS